MIGDRRSGAEEPARREEFSEAIEEGDAMFAEITEFQRRGDTSAVVEHNG
jgi:predicted RNA-binding protein with TRAM domain